MRFARLLLCLLPVCLEALPTTTVSDVISSPINGRPAIGSIVISWPSFTESDGTSVPSGSQTVTLAANGSFSISLAPTDGATVPGGGAVGSVTYTVVYQLVGGQSQQDHWNVPASPATLKIQNVLIPVAGRLRGPFGPTLPAACGLHDLFFNTTTQQEQICVAPNTWDVLLTATQVGQQYVRDSGAQGLIYRGTDPTKTRVATASDLTTTLGYVPPNPANALSEYTASASGARASLGLGTASTHNLADFLLSSQVLPITVIPTNIPVTSIAGLGTIATQPASAFQSVAALGTPNLAAKLDGNGKLLTVELPPVDVSLIANLPTIPTKTSQLTNDTGFVAGSALSTVATSGSYTDLKNLPTLNFDPAGSATAVLNQSFQIKNAFSELSTDAARIAARTALGLGVVAATNNYGDLNGRPTLSALALSGNWNDIANKPAFGTIALRNATDFVLTSAVGTAVAPLVNGTVPLANIPTIPATQLSGLAPVATSNNYADLTGKPTGLPPSGNATGDLCGTFPSPTVCGISGTKFSSIAGTNGGILAINNAGVASLAGPTSIATALGYTAPNPANALSEYTANASTVLRNLGIGSIATHPATDFLPDSGTNGFVMRINPGATRPATSADIVGLLTFTPADAAQVGVSIAPMSGGTVPIANIPKIPYTQLTGTPNLAASATTDATNATNITTGTLNVARLPVIASSLLSDAASLIHNGGPNTYMIATEPVNPPANQVTTWFGIVTKNLEAKNEYGTKTVLVQPTYAPPHYFLNSIGENGLIGSAQVQAADIGGSGADLPAGYPVSKLGGNIAGGQLPAFTGDVTSAPGSTNLMLNTVNQTPGLCGDATHSCQVTTDGKGRILSQTPVVITGSGNTNTGTGNVTGNNLTAGNILSGAGGTNITDSGKPLPAGQVVGTTDVQTLTNKSIDAGEITTGTLSSASSPALSGDVLKSAGSPVTALASVNSNIGAFGDSMHIPVVTVDAKGRVTGVSTVAAQSASGAGTVTNSTGSLAQNQLVFGNNGADVKTGNLSGDVMTSGQTATLTSVNASPGSYGDATHVPRITIDAKGRVTGTSLFTISGGTSGGAAPNSYNFTNQSSALTITHNLGTSNVVVACYDQNNKYVEFGSLSILDVNTVSVSFNGAPSGRCVVNGGVGPQGTPGATGAAGVSPVGLVHYSTAISSATTVNLSHGLGTVDIAQPVVIDSTGSPIQFSDFQVNGPNAASITFSSPVTGTVYLTGYVPSSNLAFSQAFTNLASIAVPHNLGSTAVIATVYDSSGSLVGYNSLTATDVNNATVTLSSALSGTVYISRLQ